MHRSNSNFLVFATSILIALMTASPTRGQSPPGPGPTGTATALPAVAPTGPLPTIPIAALPTTPAAAPTTAPTSGQPAGPPPPAKRPTLKIKQVNVIDSKSPSKRQCTPATNPGAGAPAAPPVAVEPPDLQILRGAGDIEVTLGRDTYSEERDETKKSAQPLRLFVNGVNLADDAKLVSQLGCGLNVHLRYRIVPGENSQKLWAALYRSSDLTKTEPLNVALGWDSVGPSSEQLTQVGAREIAVASDYAVVTAFGVVLLLCGISALVFVRTDAFRDSPSPWWSREASRQLAKLRKDRKVVDDNWLTAVYGAQFDKSKKSVYADAATRANARQLPRDQTEEWATLFGILIGGRSTREIRSTYSLARTQLGMWFLFSVAAALFLWIVYGRLPKIENSLLALLGLSMATAGVSLAIDKGNSDVSKAFSYSNGLLNDLVTGGTDNKEQVYRYQSVVVNLLLLFVGVTWVVQNLAYPLFEPTWLAFLGISGVALTAGKQILETPKVPPA